MFPNKGLWKLASYPPTETGRYGGVCFLMITFKESSRTHEKHILGLQNGREAGRKCVSPRAEEYLKIGTFLN